MYSESKPTSNAIRADKPSYTPGATMNPWGSCTMLRSLVATQIAMVSFVVDMIMTVPTGQRSPRGLYDK